MSVSFKNKLGKALQILWKRPTPLIFFLWDNIRDSFFLPILSPIWRLEAKLRGAMIGKGLFLGRPIIKLHPESKVRLENGFTLISDQRRCSSGNLYAPCRLQTHSATSSIHLGFGVGLNGASIVSRSRAIFIGKNTMLAPNCVIMDSPFHKLWPPEERNQYPGTDLDQDVFIGANCWIGTGCLILPGSNIGDNSVIGARSVVSGEIPPNSLAAGSPARVIRQLDESPNE